jgi:hypothetical protein
MLTQPMRDAPGRAAGHGIVLRCGCHLAHHPLPELAMYRRYDCGTRISMPFAWIYTLPFNRSFRRRSLRERARSVARSGGRAAGRRRWLAVGESAILPRALGALSRCTSSTRRLRMTRRGGGRQAAPVGQAVGPCCDGRCESYRGAVGDFLLHFKETMPEIFRHPRGLHRRSRRDCTRVDEGSRISVKVARLGKLRARRDPLIPTFSP